MLYIFGDSYSMPLGEKIPRSTFHSDPVNITRDTCWIDLVAKGLNKKSATITAMMGVSNEWILKSILDQLSNIKDGDTVIIQSTAPARHWFLKDPSFSNIVNIVNSPWTVDEDKAIKYYLKYLQNDNLDKILYDAFTMSLLYIAEKTKHAQIVMLPAWVGLPGITGTLSDNISNNEFDNEETLRDFYIKYGYDPRVNHMSAVNHHILADKILNFLKNGITIDLTTGFESNIYNKNNI